LTGLNLYITIIKYLLLYKYYIKYYNIININSIKNSNKIVYRLLLTIKTLFDSLEKEQYSVDELAVAFHANYPVLTEDELEYLDTALVKVTECSVSDDLATQLFESLQRQQFAESIAFKAVDVSQGRGSPEELAEHIAALEASLKRDETTTDNLFAPTDLEEIYNNEDTAGGLHWRLKTLNKIFGPLRVGDFGFIFARPEVGKTTFLASEVTCLGSQTEQPVLWVNNEQRSSAVIPRLYSAYFGATEGELYKERGKFSAIWRDSLGGRLKFVDNPSISRRELDSLCKRIKPGLIIFDQLDKVVGFDAERYDLIMKSKYQWAREIAKQYGPVIGVSQAGGTAEGKRYLDMNDVDSSHTAKQGEADWVLGIGKDTDEGLKRMRYLSVCKNKLPSHPDKIEEMRHAKVEVFINEQLARYEDKIQW
jgi:hypothetical protein